MQMQRLEDGVVVLGPCPGCQSWQLDYDDVAARSYFITELHEPEDGSVNWEVDTLPFRILVEEALGEHLSECPHLQSFLRDF